jgi:uncharacterized protein (DUF1330 family)
MDLVDLSRGETIMTRHANRIAAAMLAASTCIGVGFPRAVLAAEAKAYIIEEIQVTDATKYKDYVAQAPATVAAFGGAFIVRAGAVDVIDGTPPAGRVVVLEFPSMAKAKAWHESEAYQKILPIRNASSTSRVYIVEGVAP